MFVRLGEDIADSESREPEIFPRFKNTLSPNEAVVCLINTAIGTGILRLGYSFRCGIITALVLTTLIALVNYYSFWLYSKAINQTKRSSFVEIWYFLFGWKTLILPVAASAIGTLVFSMFFTQCIANYITSLLTELNLYENNLYINETSVLIFTFAAFVLPNVFVRSLNTVFKMSVISLGFLALLFIHSIYWMIVEYRKYGFDPSNQLKLFSFDSSVITCINALLTAYAVYPLSWPGPRHFSGVNFKSLLSIFKNLTFFCWVLYASFGTLAYFTFFDKNTGGLIISYYPFGFIRAAAEIALIFMIALTLPMQLNQARYNLMEAIFPAQTLSVHGGSWVPLGVLAGLIATFLAASKGFMGSFMSMVGDISSPILIFLLPPIIYLKAIDDKPWYHVIGSIAFALFGIFYSGYIVYLSGLF